MLKSVADGIAILGVCGVIISAIIKFTPRPNGFYVRKEACSTRVDMIKTELKNIHDELRELNRFVRGMNK